MRYRLSIPKLCQNTPISEDDFVIGFDRSFGKIIHLAGPWEKEF